MEGNATSMAARLRPGRGALLVLLAAAVAIVPELIRGNSCGHDFDVHLVSWLDCANAWRHDIFYPHWTPSPNYAAGEPRFVFYPPLTWMAGAALGIVLGWHLAPIVFTFLVLAATGLATRALAQKVLKDGAATLAGCASIFSGFTLFTAYERTAFPEFMGGVWLPLLLLFALRERRPTDGMLSRALDGSTFPLALVLGASWLSNAPLGVIASYLLAAVALAAALLRRSWAPVVRAALASVLGLGVTAFYWIPAKLEQRWVDIRQATEDPGYNFENNWAFARHADPRLLLHDAVLNQVSWISVTMIAVALVCAIVCWRRGVFAGEQTASRGWWLVLVAIPLVVLFLLFPVSRPLWWLPEWKFLQYPWRWMEAVEAPMAILFAAAVWPAGKTARRIVAGLCAAAFVGATGYTSVIYFQVCWDEDAVASVVATRQAGGGFEGMYEYEPPDSDLGEIATGLPDACLVSNPNVVLGKPAPDAGNPSWSAKDNTCSATFALQGGLNANPEHRRMSATAGENGFLILRLLSYPSWSVRVNGKRAASLPRRVDGLIAVPVEAGPVELTVDWTTPDDVEISRWLSLAGLIALLAVGWMEREEERVQVS